MDSVIMLGAALFLIPLTLIVITLNIIQSYNNKKFKREIDTLEYEKNVIDSAPVGLELSKIEAFLKNEKMEIMYNKWKSRLEDIKNKQVPKLTDMILDTEYSLSQLDYKGTEFKLTKLEMEVYLVRTNSEFLLKEIREITTSDERNRTIITSLKAKYRELYEKFTKNPEEFGDISNPINLQFETIAHRFEDFEAAMEKNEYTEVTQIIKAIDEMIVHMTFVIDEIPSIIIMTSKFLPSKIEDVLKEYNSMLESGYQLDYLNVEYNISEANKKIEDIYDRSKVLNIEDSTFELKVLNEYLDSLFLDFDKEKESRNTYEDVKRVFEKKLNKEHKLINEIFSRMDEVKAMYDLTNSNIETFEEIKTSLEELDKDYHSLLVHTSNNAFAYSQLISEIENLTNRYNDIETHLNETLEAIGSVKEDEARAREQLEEIKLILESARKEITMYNLPVIPKVYFTELSEAASAIKEINKELDNKPLNIEVLNMRVDTARDLSLKLLARAKDIIKQAKLSEMAIIYGNRYRSSYEELDKTMSYSENLFYSGEYQKSLELVVSFLNRIEPNIMDKIMNYLN